MRGGGRGGGREMKEEGSEKGKEVKRYGSTYIMLEISDPRDESANPHDNQSTGYGYLCFCVTAFCLFSSFQIFFFSSSFFVLFLC